MSTTKNREKLPLSGSEPTCTRAPFATRAAIPRNNCYAYAIQNLRTHGPAFKLQPGNISGLEGIDFNLNTCSPALKRVLTDLVQSKRGYQVDIETPCAKGYGKIALVLSKGNDFHFLRQNKDVIYPLENGDTLASVAKKFKVPLKNVVPLSKKRVRVINAGVFSHKRGIAYPPTLYDAKGNLIFDPRKANLNYGDLNYSRYCSSFCVKQKKCSQGGKKIGHLSKDGAGAGKSDRKARTSIRRRSKKVT